MSSLDHHKRLDKEQPWRRWYKTARWQKLRWAVLTRDRFTCQTCKAIEAYTSKLVCDHIQSHKGNETLFWAGPFQTLCKGCHDSLKQSRDKSGFIRGSTFEGRPTDPNHPWNAG